MRRMKCKENRLTKVSVLRKFVETLGLKLVKVPLLVPGGGTFWRLVRDHGDEICQLYAPNFIEIYTTGPQTDILDFLLNDIPWWFEEWSEKRDSGGTTSKRRRVVFNNPLFGSKSLEEAMLRLDLLDSGELKNP